jgi:hypothetical protein
MGQLTIRSRDCASLPHSGRHGPSLHLPPRRQGGGDFSDSALCAGARTPESKMFIGISNLVRGPEEIIPSFVSIESFEDRADFRGQILAATVQIVLPFLLARSEGKLDVIERWGFGSDGAGIANLIEYKPQIVGGIEQDAGQNFRRLFGEFSLVKIAAKIGVMINESGPWPICDESVNGLIKLTDVVMCTRKRQSRAMKQISYGNPILRNFRSWCDSKVLLPSHSASKSDFVMRHLYAPSTV